MDKGKVEVLEKGLIKIKNITANVITSAYGRNNYNKWIKRNNENIIYDREYGIIKKRIDGQWVQFPNDINSCANNIPRNNPSVKLDTLPITYYENQNKNNTFIKENIVLYGY